MKRIPIKKLFFGKYMYKVCLYLRKYHCNIDGKLHLTDNWYAMYNELNSIDIGNGRRRVEGSNYNIFVNDVAVVDHLCQKYPALIYEVHGPTCQEEIDFLSQNRKKILCDYYPRNRYQYKISFKTSTPYETRNNFLIWVLNTDHINNKTLFSQETLRWLKNPYWFSGPFMYIEDSSVLSMITLYLGSNIKSIEEYILRSNVVINTGSTEEPKNACSESTT